MINLKRVEGLKVIEELHKELTSKFGVSIPENEIQEMAALSAALITSQVQYSEVEQYLLNKCGKEFIYREGNKRMVLVSTTKPYVIKIAKLPGWEGIENNVTEYKTTRWWHENSSYRKELLVPYPIMLIGNDTFPGLIMIQEKHIETLDAVADSLKVQRNLNRKNVEEKIVGEVIGRGYWKFKDTLEKLADELFLDDTPLVAAAGNFGINSINGISLLDVGSAVPKNGYEARCPQCGSPMIFEVESLAALTKAGSATIAADKVKPKYVCVATMHDKLGRHDMDTDEFYQKLRNGDSSVIMTKAEAEAALRKIQISLIDENSKFTVDGKTYYLAKNTEIVNNIEILKIYDHNGEATGYGLDENHKYIKL